MSSKRTCPIAPSKAKNSLPHPEIIPSRTTLTRFRAKPGDPARAYPANSFNPNIGKDWTIAADGARFNPFPASGGGNVSTLYAASGYAAAALESIFHDVPHEPSPEISRSQVLTWQYLQLKTTRELRVVMLTNPQLRQLRVPRRIGSLREDELIHTEASQYPRTRTWAKFLHDNIPMLDGLAWRPRLGGQGIAYVFFGDRCNAVDFLIGGSPTNLDSAIEYAKIQAVAAAANIRIIDGR
jgi:hypothetical protein